MRRARTGWDGVGHEQDPEFEVRQMLADLAPGDGIGDRVVAVAVDARLDHGDVLGGQEPAVALFEDLVGEVDDGEEGHQGDGAGEDPLDDEDPAPPTDARGAFHLHETERQDGREAADEERAQVESSHSGRVLSAAIAQAGLQRRLALTVSAPRTDSTSS